MVPLMCAEEKLKAVQLWNILSEKLQEIVNNSAADINALHTNSFQEPSTSAQPNYYYYPPAKASQDEDPTSSFVPSENLGQLSKSPIPETMEGYNSLGSFSDIQCADEEDMDGVCPLPLPLGIEEASKSTTSKVRTEIDKVKIKLYECDECQISFRTKGHLLDHSRKHTGERPFQCSECGSSFTTRSNLKRHIKSHNGDKTWTCLECDAKFLEKKTLIVHMRRHTGEKPYR